MVRRHSSRPGVRRIHKNQPRRLPILWLAVFSVLSMAAVMEQTTGHRDREGSSDGSFSQRAGPFDKIRQPSPEEIVRSVRLNWPNDPDVAEAILRCESRAGADPDTWDLANPDGGPMQINRATWETYFFNKYGWTWERVAFDLQTHLLAAREIYEKAHGWDDWSCAPV
jgi:hypothetical protein